MTADRLVVGVQPVREAIRVHGQALDKVLVARDANKRLESLARFAGDQGVTLERVRRAELDRHAQGHRHQGAVTFAPPLRVTDLEDFFEEGDAESPEAPAPLIVVLDGITDPHNFGATIRSAVALGVTAIVWGENHAAPLTPATFRASAGAVEHARLVQVRSMRSAIEALEAQGIHAVALDAGAEAALPAVDLKAPTALVVGAEDTGVSRGVRRLCGGRARLPMGGPIDSLNASVAVAMAIYEARRQRDFI